MTLGLVGMLLSLGLVAPAVLYAQVAPKLGTEFQINTYTTGYQGRPHVAAAENGNFVVVWDSTQDGSFLGVFGQRYASTGTPLGTEFQINTYTSLDQRFSAVDSAPNGDFVVVWLSSNGQDGSNSGVFGQRFASNGNALGTEFQVNTYTTNHQVGAAVAVGRNGNFVVVWMSVAQDGDGGGVFGQRYASSGSALGTEFQINTYTTDDQQFPAVAVGGDGDFVVGWQGDAQNGSKTGIFAQRYASSGSALGTEFQVNTYITSTLTPPAIAGASNGDFVVVWNNNLGLTVPIFGQRYASSGSALGTEFQVNTYTTGAQQFPAVAAASNGNFIVVWQGRHDGWYDGIFAQIYASTGNALGTEFQVNTYTTLFQVLPAVAAAGNGDFVVVWESPQDGSPYGIFGQRYGMVRCAATPLDGCAAAGKSVLSIKAKSPAGASTEDKLSWRWLKGPVTTQDAFGDPTMTAVYKFCIYSGTAQTLVLEALVPQATNWQLSDNGYKYKDKDKTGSADGIMQIRLKGNTSAKIQVKGKGEHLDLKPSTLPLDESADVTVQLSHTDNSNCWQASFPPASVKKNIEARFRAEMP